MRDKNKPGKAFIVSNPQDRYSSEVEINNQRIAWKEEKEIKRMQRISVILSAVAAAAAVVGVMLQLLRG